MNGFYQFAGDHPFLTFVLALIVADVVCYPFKVINRWIRSQNIKNAGWPPVHLDADGDVVKKDDDA